MPTLLLSRIDADATERDLPRYAQLLQPDEYARAFRFRFVADRNARLASRALLRHALSERSTLTPPDWRFTDGELGKPRSESHAGDFNLSHSGELAICGVTDAGEIGVDIEANTRDVSTLLEARMVVGDAEKHRIRALAEPAKSQHFFDLWTLKEAHVKSTGHGLHKPLPEVQFDPDAADGIRASFAREANDPLPFHHYWLLRLEGYTAAVCLRSNTATPPALEIREALPFGEPANSLRVLDMRFGTNIGE